MNDILKQLDKDQGVGSTSESTINQELGGVLSAENLSIECSVLGKEHDMEHIVDIPVSSYTKDGIIQFNMPFEVCKKCGFVAAHASLGGSQADLTRVHQKVCYPNWGADNDSILRRAQWVRDFTAEHIPLGECQKVMDIGCGEGYLLRVLKELGLDCAGIEVRDEVDFEGLKAQGIKVSQMPMQEYPEGEKFDVIFMDSVLEHIPNPAEALKKIKKMLSPNGYLVILVPYILQDEKGVSVPIMTEHVNYFTPTTVEGLLRTNGFDVVAEPNPNNEISIWKKGGNPKDFTPVNDYEFAKRSIESFARQEKDKRERIVGKNLKDKLDRCFDEGKKVMFWGAGSFAVYVLENLDTINNPLFQGFTDKDNRKHGIDLYGHPVYSPEALKSKDPDVIFITTENPHFKEEIIKFVKEILGDEVEIMTMSDIY